MRTTPGTTVRRVIAGALCLVALAACGSSSPTADGTTTAPAGAGAAATTTTAGSTEPTVTTTTGATTTVPITTPASTTPEPGTGTDILPPGDSVAYLRTLGTNATVDGKDLMQVTFDVVQFLTGQAAVDAAVKHDDASDCDGTPCVDDDYYVVNDNPKLRTMPVASTADITIDGCNGGCPDQVKSTLQGAIDAVNGLFRITVVGHGSTATITAIHQVFVP